MKSALVDSLIESSISPLLRTEGFSKKGRIWNRREHDLIYVVDVQEASHGDERHTRFTLNFGVCAPKAYSICWGRSLPTCVKEQDCQLRKRVGDLLSLSTKGAIDYWWRLGAGIDGAAMGDEVATVIKGRVLPCLGSIDSLETLRVGLETSVPPDDALTSIYWAIITAMLGDINGAQQELNRVRSAHKGWSERIDAVMENMRTKGH